MSKKGKNPPRRPSNGWIALFGVVEAVLERFGWPGALLLFAVYFVDKNATQEQKHAIIDIYVLGKGIGLQYPIIVLGGIAGLAFLAQWAYYQKKVKLMSGEIKRLADWKTRHQEKQVGGPLHHSEDPEE
jgi:hypothetical protein